MDENSSGTAGCRILSENLSENLSVGIVFVRKPELRLRAGPPGIHTNVKIYKHTSRIQILSSEMVR